MQLKTASKSLDKQQALLIGIPMLVVSLGLLFWVDYTYLYNLNPPAADDIKVFWSGTRAVVLGANPYDNSPGSIYNQLRGVAGDNPNYYFLNPLYMTLLFQPLVLFPVDVAASIWSLLNQILLGFSVVLVIRGIGIEPTGKNILTGIGLGLVWRYTFLVILIGNLTLLLLCAIAASWYFSLTRRFYLAGAVAALLLIKPQVAFLIIPLLLVLPVAGEDGAAPDWKGRHTVKRVIAFGLVGLLFLSYSFAIMPGWVGTWLQTVFGSSKSYFNNQDINSQLTSLRSLVAVFITDPTLVQPVTILVSVPVWLGCLWLWWKFRNDPTVAPFLLAVIVGLNILTSPYIREYDSALMLFGLTLSFFTLQRLEKMKAYRGKWSWLIWGLALLPYPIHFLAGTTTYAVENLITLLYLLLVSLTWAASRKFRIGQPAPNTPLPIAATE